MVNILDFIDLKNYSHSLILNPELWPKAKNERSKRKHQIYIRTPINEGSMN